MIGTLSLSGCSTQSISDVCPSPHFLSCETLCEFKRKDISDGALNDVIGVTGTMLKLKTTEKKQSCVCK